MNIGPCCICAKKGKTVRNLVFLLKRSPYGHGWGCVQCGLESAGATAVICDQCAARLRREWYPDIEQELKWFMKPSSETEYSKGRAPISELADMPVYEHNMALHPECSED
jgi:hypothetical protein